MDWAMNLKELGTKGECDQTQCMKFSKTYIKYTFFKEWRKYLLTVHPTRGNIRIYKEFKCSKTNKPIKRKIEDLSK